MDKSVLITGGAHRLGAALVRTFATNGWQVWCHYNGSKTAAQKLALDLQEQGHNIKLVKANLLDAHEIEEMMRLIEKRSGQLSTLVNNASLFEPDTAEDFSVEQIRKQMDVNLIAPLLMSQMMAKQAKRTGSKGCVIHVLDQKVFNLNPDYFSYTISKLALERSVALQAQALAPNIRVCGVAPGLMFISGDQSQGNFDVASKINLLRENIDPTDVAKACEFMASNQSITGATLQVDNGQHLVPLKQDVMFVVDQIMKKTP